MVATRPPPKTQAAFPGVAEARYYDAITFWIIRLNDKPTVTERPYGRAMSCLPRMKIPMDSAYGVATISEGTIEFASPGIGVHDLPYRGPSITLRSSERNGVRPRITIRACNDRPFSAAFSGLPINGPYDNDRIGSACARSVMPPTFKRRRAMRDQALAPRPLRRGEQRRPWSCRSGRRKKRVPQPIVAGTLFFEPAARECEISLAMAAESE